MLSLAPLKTHKNFTKKIFSLLRKIVRFLQQTGILNVFLMLKFWKKKHDCDDLFKDGIFLYSVLRISGFHAQKGPIWGGFRAQKESFKRRPMIDSFHAWKPLLIGPF